MNKLFIPGLVFFSLFSLSCRNNQEPVHSSDIDPSAIYLDYQVRGEEDNELATVLLQFRLGESYGGTLTLDPPSGIQFDGKTVMADSSSVTGTFYVVQLPAAQLAGTHTIIFTDANNRTYKEEFNFHPMTLVTQVPDTLHRSDLVFDFDGLEPLDAIRVVIADTTYPGQETDQLYSTKNGQLTIKKQEIDSLANGPIQVLFIRELENPVKNSPSREGGRISFSYTIKREFLLAD
jgi:hypothetical protein